MHLVGEIKLGEHDGLEVVGHAKVEDDIHWLFRDDSVADFGKRIGANSRSLDSPTPNAIGNPGNVSILPIIGVGVPFHGVRVEIPARVLIHIVRHVRERTDGLLERSASVAVDLGDGWIIYLVVCRGIERIVAGIIRR